MGALVYRYDQAALVDWEKAMGGETLRLLTDEPVQRRCAMKCLQREYLT